MSNIADISDGLLKMEDELKSFHEVVELVDEAKATATSTIEASNRLNAAAQALAKNVEVLILDIQNLDLDEKINNLNILTTRLQNEINAVSLQIGDLEKYSQKELNVLHSKLDFLRNLTPGIQDDIHAVSSQIGVLEENSQKGMNLINSTLDTKIETVQTELHDGMVMLNGEIKGRIEALEGSIERLKVDANSFQQNSQLENEKHNKFLLILLIFGSLAIIMLAILLVLNLT
jgi:seryl-tRNA synthetase